MMTLHPSPARSCRAGEGLMSVVRIFCLLGAGLLFAGCGAADDSAASGAQALIGGEASSRCRFITHLSGDEEAPVPRETNATGQALFWVDGTMLHYKLIASNIDNVVAAHIHDGAAGVAGPVIVGL